jgi:hypothetical protein
MVSAGPLGYKIYRVSEYHLHELHPSAGNLTHYWGTHFPNTTEKIKYKKSNYATAYTSVCVGGGVFLSL